MTMQNMKKEKNTRQTEQGWQNLEMMRLLNGYLPHHFRLDVERVEVLLIEIESLKNNSFAFQQINHFGNQLSAQVNPLLKGEIDEILLDIQPLKELANQVSDAQDMGGHNLESMTMSDKLSVNVHSEEWLREVYHFHLDLIERYERILKNYQGIVKEMQVIESYVTKTVANLMCMFPEAEEMFHKMYGKRSESYKILRRELSDLKASIPLSA